MVAWIFDEVLLMLEFSCHFLEIRPVVASCSKVTAHMSPEAHESGTKRDIRSRRNTLSTRHLAASVDLLARAECILPTIQNLIGQSSSGRLSNPTFNHTYLITH